MKYTEKTISVIMPVYNGETYLREALDSILGQTYTNFEFIIIDDASDDGTAAVLDTYKDERIVRLRNDRNIGNYPSRNKGMFCAKGKYVCVMDADDMACPDRFQKQLDYLESHPRLLAAGSRFRFSDGYLGPIPLTSEEIRLYLLEENCFLHSSLMIRTSALKRLGGYREEFVYSADYDLVCRLSLLGDIENMPDLLMTYRWHPSQISQRYNKKQRECAALIRQQYQLAFIDRYKTGQQPLPDQRAVACRDIGYVIALYTLARFTGNRKYEGLANARVEKIYGQLAESPLETFGSNLCLLACGLIYLLRNGFVNGDEEDVLAEIDELGELFLRDLEDIPDPIRADWIHYLTLRRQKKNADRESAIGSKNKENPEFLPEK